MCIYDFLTKLNTVKMDFVFYAVDIFLKRFISNIRSSYYNVVIHTARIAVSVKKVYVFN